MHRLSIQCQTANGHDAKADESNEATIGDHMFSFSGKSLERDFLYALELEKEINYIFIKYKNKKCKIVL